MQDSLKDWMGEFLSQGKWHINKDWVLLDSQSTISLFRNALLLTSIQEVGTYLNIFCNAGKTKTNMVGDLKEDGTVWIYTNGISNILLLYRVAEMFHVTYNSHTESCFIVWKEDGTLRRFMPSKRWLYYFNLKETDGIILTTINTVDDNKTHYTQRQIKYSESSRKMQNKIGVTTQGLIKIFD